MHVVTECCSESRMRSRTSRGVPEWSRGKDLYIGSMVLATGSVLGITGSVPGPPEGSGGPPGGAMGPGGIHGPSLRRDQPLGGLGRLPTKAHAPGEKRGQTLGQMGPKGPCLVRLPLPPTWPPPQMGIGVAAAPRV